MVVFTTQIVLAALAIAQFVPPDPRDCGKGITCFPCLASDEPPPAAAAAIDCSGASAQRLPSTCQSNAKGRLTEDSAADADACCAKCSARADCTSWTAYGQAAKGGGVKCNLFKDTNWPGVKPGNCTTGSSDAAPPTPPPTPPPAPPTPPGPPCTDCPNILLMFTDDQDLTIGGWEPMNGETPMRRTRALFAHPAGGGMTATQWHIHTPICAPSRAELLSGRYYHNIANAQRSPPSALCGSGAVGHVDLLHKVYPHTFFRALREQKGYATGLFGKCMNGGCKNPASMAGAVDRWFEGTNFIGGSWWDNDSPDNNFENASYAGNYGTSVIGNKTIDWIRGLRAKEAEEEEKAAARIAAGAGAGAGAGGAAAAATKAPWIAFVAPHAPHTPSTPAPWYESGTFCDSIAAPRTPNFNWSTPAFHNLVSRQPPLSAKDVAGIDALARKRCKALLSVDDMYADVLAALDDMGELANTYVLITSDHGYNLGHHRLPSNKFLLYDHSLRIPMLFKGPGIKPNTTIDFLGTQVDLHPTILGFAGIEAPRVGPSAVDGQSVVPLLIGEAAAAPPSVRRHLAAAAAPVRDTAFTEYYNQGPWEVGKPHALDDWSNTYIGVTFRNASHSWKYAEYDPYGKQSNFSSVYFTELFDLNADPFELANVINESSAELRALLHAKTRHWYGCAGATCVDQL